MCLPEAIRRVLRYTPFPPPKNVIEEGGRKRFYRWCFQRLCDQSQHGGLARIASSKSCI